MKIAVVLGTHPETLALAPLIERLANHALTIHTGQGHSPGPSGPVQVEITLPDSAHRVRGHRLGAMIMALHAQLVAHRPDAVVVHGASSSALAAAVAATATGTPLAQLDAGIRGGDRSSPGDRDRFLIDHLAQWCFAPTLQAEYHLISENMPAGRIFLTAPRRGHPGHVAQAPRGAEDAAGRVVQILTDCFSWGSTRRVAPARVRA